MVILSYILHGCIVNPTRSRQRSGITFTADYSNSSHCMSSDFHKIYLCNFSLRPADQSTRDSGNARITFVRFVFKFALSAYRQYIKPNSNPFI